ncbi:MAG: CAAX prenyl protease-related protein [Phycisphaerales bacterium]|nr:CAAX prenyl protease-related protein [Phycisphaerales bacterium]
MSLRARIDALLTDRPDLAYAGPFFVYLALLGAQSLVPVEWQWAAIVLRGLGGLLAIDLVVRHIPHWGKPHAALATLAGVLAAALWVVGQHWSDSVGIPRWFPLMPGSGDVTDPRLSLGTEALWWTTATLRILVACTAVPLVEELFWRGFLLRAFIDWQRFERIPLGAFTIWSFVGTSLLSILQHPANWVVSVFCWFLFNALFCWTRSLTCLIITHAVTNLVLYIYVIESGDWRFW